MIVIREFFCTQEKKRYKEGDKYTGKRKDINAFLKMDNKKHPKSKKKAIETK